MNDRWTIDKRIPVSLIACFLAQTLGVFIWATKIDSRVDQLEKNQVSATSIAISGEKLNNLQDKVSEIKGDMGDLKKNFGDLKEEIRRSGFNGKH